MSSIVVIALALMLWRAFWIFGLAWLAMVGVIAAVIRSRNPGAPIDFLALKGLTAYLLVSAVTLPLIKSWWIGEVPPLSYSSSPSLKLPIGSGRNSSGT